MEGLIITSQVINFTFFPLVLVIYAWLAFAVKLKNVDAVAIIILGLYFIVFLVRFIGQFYEKTWIGSFPEYLVFLLT